MNFTPSQPATRSPQATLRTWEDAGLPPALAQVLQDLWDARAVTWAGADETTLERLDALWARLGDVAAAPELGQWAREVRQTLWGSPLPWGQRDHGGDLDLADRLWGQARLDLGEPVLRVIANDEWRQHLASAAQTGVTYDSLARRLARRHRERLMFLPSHPEPDGGWNIRRVGDRARHMARRFGFTHVRAAAGMPMEDLWSALGEAQEGLSAMARALGLEDDDLGAGRLGLSFELDLPHTPSALAQAYVDRLTMTINLGRLGGWGSFAHEWAHVLDQHLARHWNPNALPSEAMASHYMADPGHHQVFPAAEAQRQAWAQALWPVTSEDEGVVALSRAARQLPALFDAMRQCLPHASWEDRYAARLVSLTNWVDAVTRGDGSPMQWQEGWNRWKVGNALAWANPDDRRTRGWRQRWDAQVATAEQLLWGPWPRGPLWLAWSQARDQTEGRHYWQTPPEAWARMIQALVRQGVGHDTWAANQTTGDVFPQGPEFRGIQQWWTTHRAELLARWRAPAPAPTWTR